MAETRSPVTLPGYTLGDEGRPAHFTASIARETAAIEAKELAVGDAAFVLRSGHKWAYAVMTEKEEKDGTILRFEVDEKKNRKTFPEAVWGKYIRVIKADASELAKLEAEAEELANASKEGGVATKVEEPEKERNSATIILGEFSSEVGSWFASNWNSKKTKQNKKAAAALEPTPALLESGDKPAMASPMEDIKSNSLTASFFSSMFNEKLEEPKAKQKDEEEKIATPRLGTASAKEKIKSKSQLGSIFANIFSKKSGEHKSDPEKKNEAQVAITTMDKDKSKSPIEEPKPAQTRIDLTDQLKPATANAAEVAEVRAAIEDPPPQSPHPASNPETETAPQAVLPKCTPSLDESRDAVEEKPNLAPAAAPSKKTPVEEKSTATSPTTVEEHPAPEPEIPKPIKLLKTPFKFYKAASMKEDPAAAALAATSFADQHDGYASIQSNGVIVCKHDPAAAANAEILAQERVDGVTESPVTVMDSNAELKKQGIVIVEVE